MSLTMLTPVFVLLGLACIGHGHRMQTTITNEEMQDNAYVEHHNSQNGPHTKQARMWPLHLVTLVVALLSSRLGWSCMSTQQKEYSQYLLATPYCSRDEGTLRTLSFDIYIYISIMLSSSPPVPLQLMTPLKKVRPNIVQFEQPPLTSRPGHHPCPFHCVALLGLGCNHPVVIWLTRTLTGGFTRKTLRRELSVRGNSQ